MKVSGNLIYKKVFSFSGQTIINLNEDKMRMIMSINIEPTVL